MRGFPIVSLASLVGSYYACEVLIPEFEVDQYFGGYSSKERYIISTSLEENERLFSLFNSTIQNEEINNNTYIIPKSEIILVPGDTTCTYTDFDVRYWSEEQNNSGSDR